MRKKAAVFSHFFISAGNYQGFPAGAIG